MAATQTHRMAEQMPSLVDQEPHLGVAVALAGIICSEPAGPAGRQRQMAMLVQDTAQVVPEEVGVADQAPLDALDLPGRIGGNG